jgi:hypothetical protein
VAIYAVRNPDKLGGTIRQSALRQFAHGQSRRIDTQITIDCKDRVILGSTFSARSDRTLDTSHRPCG